MTQTPWYVEFFGEHYLAWTNAIVTPERTAAEVEGIAKLLGFLRARASLISAAAMDVSPWDSLSVATVSPASISTSHRSIRPAQMPPQRELTSNWSRATCVRYRSKAPSSR